RLDPDEYLHARKQLKRAVSEHYHALEVLNNYRILNITGFRKALKKFEKLTGILVQDVYMKEKVDPCTFASDQVVQVLLGEMEDLFTARFAKGDRKRALGHLRAGSSRTTHHFSTFRTGLALGLAFPALIDGIVRTPNASRYTIVENSTVYLWDSADSHPFCIPRGHKSANLEHCEDQLRLYLRWILELLPCIALATLCWAFWLSFARAGEPVIQPWTWPMIWLLFVVVLMINPLPVMSRASRWWFLRTVARLLKSGFSRVEFADFWLGDQLCSLAFPLSNIYFIACSYARGFHSSSLQKCGRPAPWGIPFVLGALPLVVRFVQSIRRWWDSRLITHLINGGKYFTGIVFSFCYYLWRHNGAGRDTSFVFFCLFGTIYSTYATYQDVLMDWSLLRPHARFMFLRQELLYPSHIPFYYLAIITNVLIRFIWVIYIPTRGPSLALRAWIAALLEVLRRCQWNVYRLENEHLGNMDQYRITREVPLPYSFDELSHETDAGDEDDHPNVRGSGHSSKSK
ncbi:EXS family-domain-containing protein, partial [Lactifluus subvellereus]